MVFFFDINKMVPLIVVTPHNSGYAKLVHMVFYEEFHFFKQDQLFGIKFLQLHLFMMIAFSLLG